MKDIKRPIRKAFYDRLNGALTYASVAVPYYDKGQKVKDSYNFYVILSNQSSYTDDTKNSYDRIASVTLDIVTKFNNSVTSEPADNIAGQILALIFSTTPHTNLLTPPANWQFLNVKLERDDDVQLQLSDTSHIIRRLLTFSLRVVQN